MKARGISAVDIAAQVGVTRQAIYAIEAGTYMPNTAVALRLARVLDSAVEDLFALEQEERPAVEIRAFEPLDETFRFEPGEPLQVVRMGRRAIGVTPPSFPAWLPMADGIVSSAGGAVMAGAEKRVSASSFGRQCAGVSAAAAYSLAWDGWFESLEGCALIPPQAENIFSCVDL